MEPVAVIIAILVVFSAVFLGSVGGFGSGIFGMSLLILFLPLKVAVVAMGFATFLSSLQLAWSHRKAFPLKAALPIVAGRLPGAFVGVYLLSLPIDIFAKGILASLIVLLAFKELLFPMKKRDDLPSKISVSYPAGVGLGLISGVLNGWINMGGPPIIVYSYQNFEARAARRLLIAVFALTYPFQLPMYWLRGLVTREALILFAWFVPVTILGTFIGNRLQRKIDRKVFIRIVWSVLLGLGVVLGVTAFVG